MHNRIPLGSFCDKQTRVSFSLGFLLTGSRLGARIGWVGVTLRCSIWVSSHQVEQREFTLHAMSGVHSAKKVRQKGGWEGSGREWIVLGRRDGPQTELSAGTAGPGDGASSMAGEPGCAGNQVCRHLAAGGRFLLCGVQRVLPGQGSHWKAPRRPRHRALEVFPKQLGSEAEWASQFTVTQRRLGQLSRCVCQEVSSRILFVEGRF